MIKKTWMQKLLAKAVHPSSVKVVGKYTSPKTWGVYEIEPPYELSATKHFRFGNHPVRQQELVHEFGEARLLVLFEARILAQQLAGLFNQGSASGE